MKQSIRSRCQILGANKPLTLNVPRVRKSSSKTAVKRPLHRKFKTTLGKRNIGKSLMSAYGSSPYFEYYEDEIAPLYEEKANTLLELNTSIQHKLFELLSINKELQFTTSYQKEFEGLDLRHHHFFTDCPSYTQVFGTNFTHNLSILDLLFNEGPNSETYLLELSLK